MARPRQMIGLSKPPFLERSTFKSMLKGDEAGDTCIRNVRQVVLSYQIEFALNAYN